MDYDGLQTRSRFEMAGRVEALKQDFSAWTSEPRALALGLSSKQRTALADMMLVLDGKQRDALKKLENGAPPPSVTAFADLQTALLVEMTGANELWRLFRFMLGQFEDPAVQRPLKAAGRVAADCYTHGIRRARALGAIDSNKFREVPLVYLEAVESPATAGRNDRVQALSTSVRQWRNLKLPLPIVLLPVDYVHAIWTFCALHHEVGHTLDQDLGLIAEIRSALPETVHADQEPHWRRWSAEILADAVGVLLGGAGFSLSLGTLALLLGPAARYQDLDPEAEHPPLLVRVRLLASMLRQTGVPEHAPYADQLDAIWSAAPRPAWQQPFADAAGAVAALYLGASLAALKDRPLTDLNPGMAADHAQIEALANFFLTGKKRPDPAAMHPRLVAAAAQVALWNANPVDAATVATLHQSALDYLDKVPAIGVLAVAPGQREYLRQLAGEIDFARLRAREN